MFRYQAFIFLEQSESWAPQILSNVFLFKDVQGNIIAHCETEKE